MTNTLIEEQNQNKAEEAQNQEVEEKNEEEIKKTRCTMYDELKSFINSEEGKQGLNLIVEQTKNQDDPLSRLLTEYVEENADNYNLDQKELWGIIAFAISLYISFNCIQEKFNKQCFANAVIKEINIDDYVGVIAKKGKETGVAIIPKLMIEENKLDTDEKIINFAKSMPNEFQNMQDAEFKIMSKEELEQQLNFIKSRTNNGGQKKCQN